MMSTGPRSKGFEIFFSFHPDDKKRASEVITGVKPLKSKYPNVVLSDSSKASAGQDTHQFLQDHLRSATIVVLLLSRDYLASEHCYHYEMEPTLTLAQSGATYVIPVLLRPIDQDISPLIHRQPLPSNGVPISTWPNRDEALLNVTRGIRSVVEELIGTTAQSFSMTFDDLSLSETSDTPTAFFTDRTHILEEISSRFSDTQNQLTPVLALNGLAGIGKTQIALEYSFRSASAYNHIFWLNASSLALLSKDVSTYISRFAITVDDAQNEKQLLETFQRWLRARSSWLLILDYLSDLSFLKLVVPRESRGHVLVTMQMQNTHGYAKPISVEQMDTDAGALFLLHRATFLSKEKSLNDAPPALAQKAREISEKLGGFPLALDQAGAYIEATGCDLDSYLTLYKEKLSWVLNLRYQGVDEHHRSVKSTLELVIQRYVSSFGRKDLLCLLAFLHPDAIFEKLLTEGKSVFRTHLKALVNDTSELHQAFAGLLNLSLLYRSNDDRSILQMHRLVQQLIIDPLSKDERTRWARMAVNLVNRVFPEVSFATWEECKKYLPHAQHCAELISVYKLNTRAGALLLERLGTYRFQQAAYAEAEMYLTQALEIYENNLHNERLNQAQALNSLMLLYAEMARYHKAMKLNNQALELREQELDAEHPKTIESLHNLAMLDGDQGRYRLAESRYLHLLGLEQRSSKPNNLNIAKTLNNLGLMYFYQKKYAEATDAYNQALAIYQRMASTLNPDLIHTMDGLGSIAEQQGDLQRAEHFYRQALDISLQTLKDKHPDTAHSFNKLAGIAEQRGDTQQAEQLYQQALTIGEQTLDLNHPDLALFLNNLARLASKQKDNQKARPLYERALHIYEQMEEPYPDAALFFNNLAQFYRDIHNEAQAEEFLKRALALQRDFLDPTDPDLTLTLTNLADLFIDQYRYEEATPLLQRAFAILLLGTGSPEHPQMEEVREKYTSTLEHIQRNEAAHKIRGKAQN